MQADTVVPEPGNPQALNRYSYVYNNPLRYTDPSGHYVSLEDEPEFAVRLTAGGDLRILRGGRWFRNYYERAYANYLLSGGATALPPLPTGAFGVTVISSAAHAARGLGAQDSGSSAANLLADPLFVAGLAHVAGKVAEEGAPILAGNIAQTVGMADRQSPNAISRWGEQQVGQHLPVEVRRFRVAEGQRVYDGRMLGSRQYVEIKTTTRGVVTLNPHIRGQIAFDAAQRTKPLWIFVGGSPSRGLQVELSKADIPWQVLNVP